MKAKESNCQIYALHQFKLEALQYTLEQGNYRYLSCCICHCLINQDACISKLREMKLLKNQDFGETISYLLTNRGFMAGIFTEFLYVCMQVAVSSSAIRLALNLNEIT